MNYESIIFHKNNNYLISYILHIIMTTDVEISQTYVLKLVKNMKFYELLLNTYFERININEIIIIDENEIENERLEARNNSVRKRKVRK